LKANQTDAKTATTTAAFFNILITWPKYAAKC